VPSAFNVEKILFVTNDFPPQSGGIQTFIEGLIYQLPPESVVVHTSSQSSEVEQTRYDQEIFHQLGAIVVRDRQRILLPTPGLRARVAGTIHAHSIKTVVFGASVPLGLLAPSLRRLGVTRMVALTHGHEVWWSKVPLFSHLLRRVARSVDVLTYLGSFTKSAISAALDARDLSKLMALPPGVDIENFHPGDKSEELLKRYGLSGKLIILCVGRLVQRKGQDALIKALSKVRGQFPNAQLVIAGSGNYEERLRALAKKEGVAQSVSFLGRVPFEDLPALFRSADIFASPTRERFAGLEVEGLGIVYLEASASGVPVIAGDSGGSPDAVQQDVTGKVVAGSDIDGLAKALTELLADAQLRAQMGSAGRLWMESQWSWQVIGARFRHLLQLN
jgi:phosphatidylinositol alpha-1,6-mannosyltransferase